MKNKKQETSQLTGIYGVVERIGNKVPHPVVLFMYLLFGAFALSLILSLCHVSVVNPTTGETVYVVNVLSSSQFGLFLSKMGKTFMSFSPMLTVPLCTLGLAVANHSGLLKTTLKLAGTAKSKFLMTYIIAFVGVCGNLVGDAAFIIFPPLVAMLFVSQKRNPLAGLFLSFASVSVGFGANVIVGSGDAIVAGLTESAAQIVDKDFVGSPMMGYYFLLVSSFLMSLMCTLVTLKIVEPKLNRNGLGIATTEEDIQGQDTKMTKDEKKGLKATLISIAIFTAVIVLFCQKGMPFEAPEGGSITTGLLLKCIPSLIFFLFFITGYVYGKVTGSIKKFTDTIPMMQKELATITGFLLICFFASQFIYIFATSNIAFVLAVLGGEFLQNLGLSSAVTLALFVVLAALINLVMGSLSAKWALLSTIFVPMLMFAGISPAATQTAYRMGDSITNNLTPTLPYLAVILGYAQQYDPKAKTGTVMAYMLPFTLICGAVWIVFLLIWCYLGIPVGPGYMPFM